MGGLKLVGVLAGSGDDSIIVSIDQNIAGEFKRRLNEDKGYLKTALAANGVVIEPTSTEYLTVINTKLFVDIVRGFMPMLLAQQGAGANAKDADEILNLLRVTMASFQTSTRDGNMVCTQSQGVVMSAGS